MKRVTYKCNLSKDNRPEWARCITSALNNLYSRPMKGDRADFESIKKSLDRLIYNLKSGNRIQSEVTTHIVEDFNETVLFIRRGGRVFISVYIK